MQDNNTENYLKEQRKRLLTSKKVKISCIVPVFNEEEGIKNFISSLNEKIQQFSENYEILVIDDGSTDSTFNIIQNLTKSIPIKIIKFSRNFGKEIALTAGIENCDADLAILIDSDFQHPLNLIEKFLEKWSLGFNMIYGIRENRDDEPFIKRIFTNIFYNLMKKITKTKITPNAGDFRLLDKKAITAIKQFKEHAIFMKGLYSWIGFKSIGIPFKVEKRKKGFSSWNFSKLIELALTGITSFSNLPLRIWSFFGLIVSIISIICVLYIIIKTLIFGIDVPGYATLLTTITFFGGIQLFSIGILGEYIAKIFNDVKKRPKYIIDEKIGF